MDTVYIAVAGFGGAVVEGLLGWAKSGENFSFRKFFPTLLRAIGTGGAIAMTLPLVQIPGLAPGLIGAFLTGAGVDVLWHNAAGTIGNVQK